MRRRLFRIIIRSFNVLSLLLCVGTCALWVRSYSVFHYAGYEVGTDACSIVGFTSKSGMLWLGYAHFKARDGHKGFYWRSHAPYSLRTMGRRP